MSTMRLALCLLCLISLSACDDAEEHIYSRAKTTIKFAYKCHRDQRTEKECLELLKRDMKKPEAK